MKIFVERFCHTSKIIICPEPPKWTPSLQIFGLQPKK
jgi:hypothetical protein